MFESLGYEDLRKLFEANPVGSPVNDHVIDVPPEPSPDFEAMRRAVQGAPDSPSPSPPSAPTHSDDA